MYQGRKIHTTLTFNSSQIRIYLRITCLDLSPPITLINTRRRPDQYPDLVQKRKVLFLEAQPSAGEPDLWSKIKVLFLLALPFLGEPVQ